MRRLVDMAVGLAAALLAAGAAAAPPAAVEPLCDRLLPPKEAERLVGVKPLELVPRNAVKLATGTCNYATTAKGERALAFLVSVARDTTAEELEQLRGVAVKPRIVWGLDAVAFQAEGLVGLRKGTTIVTIGTFPDPKTGKRRVEDAKLIETAKVLVTRL